jgi:uncharacterized repeat protein (TIGR03803 family)
MTKLRTHRLFTFIPRQSRDGASLEKLSLPAVVCIVVLFCAAARIAAPAQGNFFTTLVNFNGANGGGTSASLIQASDGNFYGTSGGGAYQDGIVFKMTPSGTLTTLHNFNGSDGYNVSAGLVQGTDGNFYGITTQGGAYSNGTVFKITPTGTLTTLYNFCPQDGCTDGAYPYDALVQGSDGNFYGAAAGGANYCGLDQCGVIYKITPEGAFTTLHSFDGSDGDGPNGLVQGSDGNFYGTTSAAGAYGNGTVFKMTPAGMVTALYSFCSQENCADGSGPVAGLVQATDGNFYGTTYGGGGVPTNCTFSQPGCGTVFKITASGVLTTLHSFCASGPPCTDGHGPLAGLVQATDGNFYGTASDGGAGRGFGTVFEITPTGTLTTLHVFDYSDGYLVAAGVVQGSDGNFYGTTFQGGAYGYGTVFRVGNVVVAPCARCSP